jgi:hypothetical protein
MQHAERASADAKAAIAEVAEVLDAPGRVLAAAARITDHRPQRNEPDRTWARRLAAIHHLEAGPTERLLRDLNVSDAEMLTRAAEIDRATEQSSCLPASNRTECAAKDWWQI